MKISYFFYISRNFSIIFLINVYTASKYKTFSYQFNTFSSDFSLIVKKIAVILHFEMFLAAHLPKIFSRSQHFVKYLFNNLECIFAKLNNHRRLHSRSRLLLSSTVFDASFSWPEHSTISLTEFWSLLVSVTTSEWNSRWLLSPNNESWLVKLNSHNWEIYATYKVLRRRNSCRKIHSTQVDLYIVHVLMIQGDVVCCHCLAGVGRRHLNLIRCFRQRLIVFVLFILWIQLNH